MKKTIILISALAFFSINTIHSLAFAIIEEEKPDTVSYTPGEALLLTGFTTMSGYMREGEMINEDQQKTYFLIEDYGSESYKKAIEDFYNQGQKEVLKIDDKYAIKIGCYSEKYKEIESPQFNLGKGDPYYWKILTSKKEAPTTLKTSIHFEEGMFNAGKECLSLVNNFVDEKADNEYPYGKYAVEGYYIQEKDEIYESTYDQGYFVAKKYLDNNNLKDYFGKEINEGNTVNGKFEDNNYKINLGCINNDSVGTSWFSIDGDEYKTLKNSHKTKTVKANIYMGAMPIVDGPCISLINNIEISNVTVENPGTFPDVSTTHTNNNAIEDLFKKGVINGNPDGTFLPETPINRAELTKMVVEMMAGTPDATNYNNCFPDVKDEWFAKYVCYAKKYKWIEGYPDGNFKPEKSTNRAEAAKIVLNAFYNGKIPQLLAEVEASLNIPNDVDSNEWYYKFVKYGIGKNIFDLHHVFYKFDNSYDYKLIDNILRKEVAELIFRLMSM